MPHFPSSIPSNGGLVALRKRERLSTAGDGLCQTWSQRLAGQASPFSGKAGHNPNYFGDTETSGTMYWVATRQYPLTNVHIIGLRDARGQPSLLFGTSAPSKSGTAGVGGCRCSARALRADAPCHRGWFPRQSFIPPRPPKKKKRKTASPWTSAERQSRTAVGHWPTGVG